MRETWASLLTFGSLLAIAWSILQFYVGYDGTFPTMIVRPWHVTLAATVAFASIPLFRRGRSQDRHVPFSALGRPDQVLSAVLIAVFILIGVYFAVHGVRLESRTPFVDELEVMDLVVGSLVVLLVLEATRRVTGLALPIEIICVNSTKIISKRVINIKPSYSGNWNSNCLRPTANDLAPSSYAARSTVDQFQPSKRAPGPPGPWCVIGDALSVAPYARGPALQPRPLAMRAHSSAA